MIARSVVVPSNVTRMVSYMLIRFCRLVVPASSAGDNLPRGFERVRQAVEVHRADQDSTAPTSNQQEPTVLPSPHSLARTCEVQQREHRKRKLQRQHHLAQSQQIGNAAVAPQSDDNDRWQPAVVIIGLR